MALTGAATRCGVMGAGKKAAIVLLGFFLIMPVAFLAAWAQLSPDAESETSHLLEYVEKSGCEFYRNGVRYDDSKIVRQHIEAKSQLYWSRIHSAEDFIRWAATRSETSGQPYMVKCGKGPAVSTAQWLTAELDRYRKDGAAGAPEGRAVP